MYAYDTINELMESYTLLGVFLCYAKYNTLYKTSTCTQSYTHHYVCMYVCIYMYVCTYVRWIDQSFIPCRSFSSTIWIICLLRSNLSDWSSSLTQLSQRGSTLNSCRSRWISLIIFRVYVVQHIM